MIKSDRCSGHIMDDPYVGGLIAEYTPHPSTYYSIGEHTSLFEWADGNSDCEDRSGTFVSLNEVNKLVVGGKNPIGITTEASYSGDPAGQWVNLSGIGTLVIDQENLDTLGILAKINSKTGKLTSKRRFTSKKGAVRILDSKGDPYSEANVKVKVMGKWH